jgi:hypothetical protein
MGKRWQIFVPLLVLTLAVMAALNVVDGPLKTGTAPRGIVSYELAGSVAGARAILDAWDPQAHVYAGFSLGFVFLFLVFYSVTIAYACVWVSGGLQGFWRPLASAGLLLAWGQGVAALCDAIENAALLVMLLGAAAVPWPQVARGCATVKFTLVFLGLVYVVVGGVWVAVGARRSS